MNLVQGVGVFSAESDAFGLKGCFELIKSKQAERGVPDYYERLNNLKKLRDAIRSNSNAIIKSLSRDYGHRAAEESRITEIGNTIEHINFAIKHLHRWMRTKSKHTSMWFLPGANHLRPEPVGLVGIMVPWNYPVNLSIVPLCAALAAGNRAMIKMSELTPATEKIISEVLGSAFDKGTVAVFGGESDVASAFSELPFDHLFFTGSTRVGKSVMAAASKNLTPVTLELGGKSPVILDADYPVEEMCRRVLWGKTYNAGQTCVAPDYALVPKGSIEDIIVWMSRHYREHFPNGVASPDYSNIVNSRNHTRLLSLIDEAEGSGARIVRLEEPAASKATQQKIPLTLVINPPADSKIMQEEIFGPILPVIEVESTEEAIQFVRAREKPLALYYFGKSSKNSSRVIDWTSSGGVTLNDVMMQYLQVDQPFGGVGGSGMGTYHGEDGFRTFSHMKPIFSQRGPGRFTGVKLLYPPYGMLGKLVIKMMGG